MPNDVLTSKPSHGNEIGIILSCAHIIMNIMKLIPIGFIRLLKNINGLRRNAMNKEQKH